MKRSLSEKEIKDRIYEELKKSQMELYPLRWEFVKCFYLRKFMKLIQFCYTEGYP